MSKARSVSQFQPFASTARSRRFTTAVPFLPQQLRLFLPPSLLPLKFVLASAAHAPNTGEIEMDRVGDPPAYWSQAWPVRKEQ
jgi:predicted nicotinamide N-methyase